MIVVELIFNAMCNRCCLFLLFLAILCVLGSNDINVQQGCSDYNVIEGLARKSQLTHLYHSPVDSISRLCSDVIRVRDQKYIFQSNLNWNDVLIAVLYGHGRRIDALKWWLQFVRDPIEIVIMAEACPFGTSNKCPDPAWRAVAELKKSHPHIDFEIIRANPWEKSYDKLFCKVRTCMSKIFNRYPNKKYYFKIDTDTLLLPGRLFRVLNMLHSVTDTDKHPYYFGTVIESGSGRLLCGDRPQWAAEGPQDKGGLCFAQGGAGYGLNNVAMQYLTNNDTGCGRDYIGLELWPEDVFTALQLYRTAAGLTVMHCSGFRSSEVVTEVLLQQAITFHYINASWLKAYGPKLVHYYESIG